MQSISIDSNYDTGRVPGSIPMSMPAILQVRKPVSANLPLSDSAAVSRGARAHRHAPDQARPLGGKRKLKRIENDSLSHNPHAVKPAKSDLLPAPPALVPTFVPTPKQFERHADAPAGATLTVDNASSASGLYHLSLKGVRRSLKSGRGGTIEETLRILEDELRSWIADNTSSAVYDRSSRSIRMPSGSSAAEEDNSVELVSSTHSQLVLIIASSHTRFLMHCLARYYQLPSFSRPYSPSDPRRVTHILRPQLNFPAPPGSGLDTPPMTEGSEQSEVALSEWSESESDVADWAELRDVPPLDRQTGVTQASEEDSRESDDEEAGDTTVLAASSAAIDADVEPSDSETDDAASVVSSIASLPGVGTFPPPPANSTRPFSRITNATRAPGIRTRARSTSSPSRSPTRFPIRTSLAHEARAKEWTMPQQSFADWLFEL